MTTNLHPDLAKGLFRPRLKGPGERALERRESGDDRTGGGAPESGEDQLARAAENNHRHDGDKEQD